MLSQLWFCEKCRALGVVLFEGGEDCMSVMHKISGAHYEASSSCDNPPRVVVLENVTKDEIFMRGLT